MVKIYKTPNVYIEEISTLPPSVATVSTAIPAFIGYTEKALDGKKNLTNKPTLITSLLNYETLFGKAEPTNFNIDVNEDEISIESIPDFKYLMYYALQIFFDNGGGNCYIVSVGSYTAGKNKKDFEKGLAALEQEDEPTLILLTDATKLDSEIDQDYYDLCQKALAQCNKLQDRFGIFEVLDGSSDTYDEKKITDFRNGIGQNYLKYGAAYYPYLQTSLNYYYDDDSVMVKSEGSYFESTFQGLRINYTGSKSDEPKVEISENQESGGGIDFSITDDKILEIKIKKQGETTTEEIITAWDTWEAPEGDRQSFDIEPNVNTIKTQTLTPLDTDFELRLEGMKISYTGSYSDEPKVQIIKNESDDIDFNITDDNTLEIKIQNIEYTRVEEHIIEAWNVWEGDRQNFNIDLGDEVHDDIYIVSATVTKDEDGTVIKNEDGEDIPLILPLLPLTTQNFESTIEGLKITYTGSNSDQPNVKIIRNDNNDIDFENIVVNSLTIKIKAEGDTSVEEITAAWQRRGRSCEGFNIEAGNIQTKTTTPIKSYFESTVEGLKISYRGVKSDKPQVKIIKNSINNIGFNTDGKTLTIKIKAEGDTTVGEIITAWNESEDERQNFEVSSNGDQTQNVAEQEETFLTLLKSLLRFYTTEPNGIIVTHQGRADKQPKVTIIKGSKNQISFRITDLTLEITIKKEGDTTVEEIIDEWEKQTYKKNFEVEQDGDGSADVVPLSTKELGDGHPLSYYKIDNTDFYNQVKTEIDKERIILPPSAAVAGVYAKVDRDRGVWKAPANVSLVSTIGPTIKINNELQENLNVHSTGKSVNAIRSFTGKGTLVWGARTLAGNDNEWRYIPVRRLFNYIEESLKKSTEFAVFEPNNTITWLKVKSMSENFLEELWRQGALAGSAPEQAFFVNVGLGTSMTQEDILEGRMIVEIGIAAVRPAEFIILRFSHKLQEA
ncbi:phage tail sheath C-terminal domain-containing protein [Okeania sp. SIO2C9]|uniref:phage tail sheath C-terminal domain-containing protein n=1 Tax=Okeania sp. SIO2C9 TaxID=2607791 RepID=UPI0025E791FE|nr:phage tail sheath C-terminal domain-containing protein [Okeania sp. SIO2C9]